MLDALFITTAETDTDAHTFGASIDPVIVCRPFLKESCNITLGELIDTFDESKDSFPESRVRGTENAKEAKITNAIIAAEIQRRMLFIQ